ncbi:MAG: pyrophosphatase [Spirochaetales bacterium]|nr:MAG: pyrophosphatase [Spirochaetales bacterium]
MTLEELTVKIKDVADKYADKFDIHRDDDWYMFKLQEELGELTQHFLMMTGRARAKGFTRDELRQSFKDEVADTFSQLILLAAHFEVDIEDAVESKWFQFLKD